MFYLFYGCKLLKKLDISNWDTSSANDMRCMFYGCESLKEIDISGWDISNVTNIDYMFDKCDEAIIPDWYKKFRN